MGRRRLADHQLYRHPGVEVHLTSNSLPGHLTPGHVTPGHLTPGHVTPSHLTPGHVTPGHFDAPLHHFGGGAAAIDPSSFSTASGAHYNHKITSIAPRIVSDIYGGLCVAAGALCYALAVLTYLSSKALTLVSFKWNHYCFEYLCLFCGTILLFEAIPCYRRSPHTRGSVPFVSHIFRCHAIGFALMLFWSKCAVYHKSPWGFYGLTTNDISSNENIFNDEPDFGTANYLHFNDNNTIINDDANMNGEGLNILLAESNWPQSLYGFNVPEVAKISSKEATASKLYLTYESELTDLTFMLALLYVVTLALHLTQHTFGVHGSHKHHKACALLQILCCCCCFLKSSRCRRWTATLFDALFGLASRILGSISAAVLLFLLNIRMLHSGVSFAKLHIRNLADVSDLHARHALFAGHGLVYVVVCLSILFPGCRKKHGVLGVFLTLALLAQCGLLLVTQLHLPVLHHQFPSFPRWETAAVSAASVVLLLSAIVLHSFTVYFRPRKHRIANSRALNFSIPVQPPPWTHNLLHAGQIV